MNNVLSLNTKPSHILRLSAAVLAVGISLVLAANPAVAVAQDSSRDSSRDTDPKPVVTTPAETPTGSWLYTVTIPGYTFKGIETYDAGGGYTEADQLSFAPFGVASAGHGVWQSTGNTTFLLTYTNLTFDGFSTGNPTGRLVVRQTTTLIQGANLYTGSGDYTYYDLKGNAIPSISGKFTITATRLKISAPAQ